MDVTSEILNEAWRACSDPKFDTVAGIACCPQVEAKLKQIYPQSLTDWSYVPLLIDPRLGIDSSELYRDSKLWEIRCQEQSDWFNQSLTTTAGTIL